MSDIQRQRQMLEEATRRLGERDALIMALINHPTNPLTNDDLRRLIERRPERYGRYAGLVGKLRDA